MFEPSRRVIFALGALAIGCQGGMEVAGVITMTAEVRAKVSRESPAVLKVLRLRPPERGELSHILGVFCALPEEIPFTFEEGGCQDDAVTIVARLSKLEPRPPSPPWDCEAPVSFYYYLDRTTIAEAAKTVTFEHSGTPCRAASLRLDLQLGADASSF